MEDKTFKIYEYFQEVYATEYTLRRSRPFMFDGFFICKNETI